MGLLQNSDAARQWFAFVAPGYDTVVSALFWPDWLPYADNTFDRIVSIGSILYWATPTDVLREAYRVTKPGGSILVMGFHRLPFSAWNPVQNVQEMINSTLFFRYSRDEATQLFRTAGWRDENHTITGPEWSPTLVIATTARKPA